MRTRSCLSLPGRMSIATGTLMLSSCSRVEAVYSNDARIAKTRYPHFAVRTVQRIAPCAESAASKFISWNRYTGYRIGMVPISPGHRCPNRESASNSAITHQNFATTHTQPRRILPLYIPMAFTTFFSNSATVLVHLTITNNCSKSAGGPRPP